MFKDFDVCIVWIDVMQECCQLVGLIFYQFKWCGVVVCMLWVVILGCSCLSDVEIVVDNLFQCIIDIVVDGCVCYVDGGML